MQFHRNKAHLLCAAVLLLVPVQAGAEAGRPITLAQALKRVVTANPRLAVAEREIGVVAGHRIQAAAIPNPEFAPLVENVLGSGQYKGSQSAQTTLTLSQLIEFPGKRDARIAATSAEFDSSQWQLQSERLEVLSETAVAFVNILGAQRRIQILDGIIASLDGLTPLLQRRVELGASSPADISRAQVAADLIRVDRERAKTALDTARRELAVLMGQGTPDFGQAVGALGSVATPPALAKLMRALDDHPQLVRWTAIRAQRRAELISARLKPLPDVRLGAGYRLFRETRDNAWVFGLSMDIPLWDQNQGAILSAQENEVTLRTPKV